MLWRESGRYPYALRAKLRGTTNTKKSLELYENYQRKTGGGGRKILSKIRDFPKFDGRYIY